MGRNKPPTRYHIKFMRTLKVTRSHCFRAVFPSFAHTTMIADRNGPKPPIKSRGNLQFSGTSMYAGIQIAQLTSNARTKNIQMVTEAESLLLANLISVLTFSGHIPSRLTTAFTCGPAARNVMPRKPIMPARQVQRFVRPRPLTLIHGGGLGKPIHVFSGLAGEHLDLEPLFGQWLH